MKSVCSKANVEIRSTPYGRVDMTDLQLVLHSRRVQQLKHVKQLGGAYDIFPEAVHTRLSHAIGTAHLTKVRTRWLRRKEEAEDRISEEEAINTNIYGLVHDVGHGPFSHLIESLRGDHDEIGIKVVLNELADPIRKSGGDPEMVAKLMRRKSTLSQIVHVNPIGTDKLDYIVRDSSFALHELPRVDDFEVKHVDWTREKGLYVLSKGLVQLEHLVERYWFQYSEIYERGSMRNYQRFLQETVRLGCSCDPIIELQMRHGGEESVMGAIAYWCGEYPGTELAERLRLLQERDYPKKALVYTPSPEATSYRLKPTFAIRECPEELVERSAKWTMDQLLRLEREIAELLSLKPTQVSVAGSPPFRRWQVPEVQVQNSYGEIKLLKELAPHLNTAAEGKARTVCNILVGVNANNRKRLVADTEAQKAILKILEAA